MSHIASNFCERVACGEMTNATARIGAWLIGAAELTGGFPLLISFRQIREGFDKDGVHVAGTDSRHATIMHSIADLEDMGLLKVNETSEAGCSPRAKAFTWGTA